MKAAAQTAKPIPKKADRIPFEEMCRLMRVYGPVKCLRNRQKSGVANMKVESVKRKFYRWFPDLDERFVRDNGGYYRPRFGHGFEMRYRLEMRTTDGETLSRKRTRRRNERLVGAGAASAISRKTVHDGVGMVSGIGTKQARAPLSKPPLGVVSPSFSLHSGANGVKQDCVPLPTRPLRIVPLSSPFHGEASTGCASVYPPEVLSGPALPSLLHRKLNRAKGDDVGLDSLDNSFVADVGIFEDVDRTFYGPCEAQPRPTIPLSRVVSSPSSSSGSEEEQGPGIPQWDSIDDLLDESMDAYCEEILTSTSNDLGSGFHFGSL